jgi:hypothetical protein
VQSPRFSELGQEIRTSSISSNNKPGEIESMAFRSRTGAIVLIIVGALFLMSNLGLIPQIGPLLRQWWPLILIVVGVVMLVQRS